MSDGLKFIAACIMEGHAGPILKAQPDIFNEGQEATAHEFVLAHHRLYRVLPDADTIRTEVGVTLPTRIREPARYYEDVLYARHAHNSAIEPFGALRESMADKTPAGIARAQEHALVLAQTLRGTRTRDNVVNMATLGLRITDRFRRSMMTEGLSGITSGWAEIDIQTMGWQNGDLVTFVGRPEMGKTYLLLWQLWAAIAAGKRVLLITTEMSAEQMGRRLAVINLGLDPRRLKEGRVTTHTQNMITGMFTDPVYQDLLYIASLGMNASTSAIEALCDELRPDAVYVDGVYLLKPRKKGNMSRTEKVAEVFDELKQQTIDFDLPYLCTSQFNRGAGKGGRDGSLETVGQSDAISQHSSIVVAIKPGSTVDPRASRDLEFIKGREGETGIITIRYGFKPVDFSAMSEDEIMRQDEATTGADA